MTGNSPDVRCDEYGFLTDPDMWDHALAQHLAEELGIGPLTEDHWKLIGYVREHWLRTGAIHPAQQICAHFGLPKRCVWNLFGGPLELWKVAGLPYPGTEAYTYMENEEPAPPTPPGIGLTLDPSAGPPPTRST